MYTYDETYLIRHLRKLNTASMVAFAAACATRLFPAYDAYVREKGLSSADFVALAASLWTSVQGNRGFRAKIEDSELAAIPNDDEGGYDLSFLASDATASLMYASWVANDDSPQSAAWAARRAYEAFDWAAQRRPTMPQDRYDEAALLADPFVQAELRQQAADIDDLLRHGDKTDFVAMEARAVAARANMEAAIAVVLAARQ